MKFIYEKRHWIERIMEADHYKRKFEKIEKIKGRQKLGEDELAEKNSLIFRMEDRYGK